MGNTISDSSDSENENNSDVENQLSQSDKESSDEEYVKKKT